MTTYYCYTMQVLLKSGKTVDYYPVSRTVFGAMLHTARRYRSVGYYWIKPVERREYVTL